VEALLDVEYIEAVASPIPLTVINSVSYSLFDWSSALNNDPTAAWVQSVSYGNDEVQQTSDDYMYSCNTQFMMVSKKNSFFLFFESQSLTSTLDVVNRTALAACRCSLRPATRACGAALA
jgi:hypothetical protein